MANLFPPPAAYALPLTLGQDVVVDFQQRVGGVYTPYADGVVVALVIDTTPVTEAEAEITGYHAVCHIESTAADPIKKGVLWRCRVSIPDGERTLDLVPVNGMTVRYDGGGR